MKVRGPISQVLGSSLGRAFALRETVVPPRAKVWVPVSMRLSAVRPLQVSVLVQSRGGLCQSAALEVTPAYLRFGPGQRTVRSQVLVSNPDHKPWRLQQHDTVAVLCAVTQVPPDGNEMTGEATPSVQRGAISSDLTRPQREQVQKLLRAHDQVFCSSDLDIGHRIMQKHRIRLADTVPFRETTRRIPPALLKEVRAHLAEMLDLGVIKRSNSPYSSNVVLVRKANGELRLTLDLRNLNKRSIRDAFNIPRIDTTIDSLNGSRYFTRLDCKSAFWQVELEEDSKECTAFSVESCGLFQCERMPFG